MPIQILMPALSPTMTEGTLVKWTKKEGEPVKAGDILAEIETDKATMEVEAVDEGQLGKILVPEGTENVKVNHPIALLLEEGEDPSTLENAPVPSSPPPASPSPRNEPKTSPKAPLPQTAHPSSGHRIPTSPLARRIAEQANLNLSSVRGTGPHGRIVKEDVEKALAKGPQTARPFPTSASLTGFEPDYEVLPVSAMRKVIAKRLTEAKQTVPHFYLTVECDIEMLLKAREKINKQAEEGAYKLSVNDFIIKACALALKQVPEANTSWINEEIYHYASADIAVAVAIEGGLITPVVRKAETKGLIKISQEMKELASRARAGKLKPEEFQGGTFTLSNLGMYGIKDFGAIVNPPQSCILAVGQAGERAVVRGGVVSVSTLMTCTLSVDHRSVDGAVAAQFLKAFKEMIENPIMMMV